MGVELFRPGESGGLEGRRSVFYGVRRYNVFRFCILNARGVRIVLMLNGWHTFI